MSLVPIDAAVLLQLGVLLGIWAVLLFGGFAFGHINATRTRRMPTWTRMGSSLSLVLAGWSWFLAIRHGSTAIVALLIALGMTLGFVGDLALAGVLRLATSGDPTLGGIAAFGLGHISYIVALTLLGNLAHLSSPLPRFGALAVWLALGLAGWYVVVARRRGMTLLRWAALAYALLLAATAGMATGLALQAPVFVPLAIGAGLFLVSDLILAGEMFNQLAFPLIGDVVWLTYGPAQALIVFGTALGLHALA